MAGPALRGITLPVLKNLELLVPEGHCSPQPELPVPRFLEARVGTCLGELPKPVLTLSRH